MPSAKEVVPGKWSNITVLFDDGEYSVIAGTYAQQRHCLGERWNGGADSLGFPSQAGYPIYHVIPEFLSSWVLHGLLKELTRNTRINGRDHYINAVVKELEMVNAT